MKIYTYYEGLGNNEDPLELKLIDLWKTSWRNYGYDPVVLTILDSKSNPFFEKFNNEIKHLHVEIMGFPITHYGMACWNRWLAYSMQSDKKFYVSDYDVINNGFHTLEPNDNLNFYDGDCPCFASGTPKQFQSLCEYFISITQNNFDTIKNVAIQKPWYHDQNFFICNKDYLPDYIQLQNNRDSFFSPHTEQSSHYKVIHFSHCRCGTNKNRINTIEKLLKNQDQC